MSAFKTFLLPAIKGGKIAFFQDPTALHPEGRILEADFTRANTPEDGDYSGAVLMGVNGLPVLLGEDAVPWSYLGEPCPVIEILPSIRSLINDSGVYVNPTVASQSYLADDPIDGIRTIRVEMDTAEPLVVVRFNDPDTIPTSTDLQVQLLYKTTLAPTSITIDPGDEASVTLDEAPTAGEWTMVKATVNTGGISNQHIDLNLVGLPNGAIFDFILSVYVSDVDLGFLPPIATVYPTRQEGLLQFDDLIDEKVFGSGGEFSLLVELPRVYAGGTTTPIRIREGSTLEVGIKSAAAGFRYWTDGNAAGVKGDTIDPSKPFILTGDGSTFKVYQGGQLLVNDTRTPSVTLDRVDIIAPSDAYQLKRLALAPSAISAADAFRTLQALE